MVRTTRFQAGKYLDTPTRQAEYISAALETGDAGFVRDAVGIVARARGMSSVARMTGLNRESLYKAFGETGNPEFGTMLGVLRALGLELAARPAKAGPRGRQGRKEKAAVRLELKLPNAETRTAMEESRRLMKKHNTRFIE